MSDAIEHYRQIAATQRVVSGNRPQLLDDPGVVWIVESGTIAIFAVPLVDGKISGRRQYLFEVESGAALFGWEEGDCGLLAVAIEPATVLQIPAKAFDDLLAQGSSEAIASFEIWTQGAIAAVDEVDRNIELPQPSLAALDSFHGRIRQALDRLERHQRHRQWQRLNAKLRVNREVEDTALARLAATVQPRQAAEIEGDRDPLLAAAGAVARALGARVSPPAASEDLHRLKDPLQAIARASRLRIRKVLLLDDWWRQDSGPLLAYTRESQRPVALLPLQATRYQLYDPSDGSRRRVNAKVARSLEPVAYTFYRSFGDRAIGVWDLFQFVWREIRSDAKTIALSSFALALLTMLVPQATALLVDRAIPDADRSLLWQIGLGLLGTAVGAAACQLTLAFASLRVETLVESSVQTAVWDRLLKLKVSFFRQYSTGELQSRVMAIARMRQYLSAITLKTLFASAFSLLTLGLLFYYSVPLASIASAIAVISALVTGVSGAIARRQLDELQQVEGDILSLMVQSIAGVSKLRVAAAEERAFAAWVRRYARQMHLNARKQQLEDGVAIANTILPAIASALFFAAASGLQDNPSFTVGTFVAFDAAFGIFINGVTNLSDTAVEILEASILWQWMKPILQAVPEVDGGKTDPGRLSGAIRVHRVSFRYRPNAPLVLENLDLHAEPGEFIAIVGPSGSGKSTIFRLLLGFETPESGRLTYDGRDLAELDIAAVRRQLGVVIQNSTINSASIFENISGGAIVTMDEAWEAADLAGLADDIAEMPMGMHTVISEGGTNLSGGQRQRLLLARAVALRPAIILLDEATRFLDNPTQALVSENLEDLNVTRIAIAHRLSTIRHADRIYVLDGGRVVQQGTFEGLMRQEGLFQRLMVRQMARSSKDELS